MTARTKRIDGVLLLYHQPPGENAATVMHHVDSFAHFSHFPVFAVNTDCGFPRALSSHDFRVIVLHYSLFAGSHYFLPRRFLELLDQNRGEHTIAFFQDEHRYCRKRFAFLNEFDIDVVYTLLDPQQHAAVYGRATSVADIRTTLPGYVDDELVEMAGRFGKPFEERTVDVGYRTRRLPYWMGRGSQEKHEIGERFREQTNGLGLVVDIEIEESSRVYGEAWYRFLANCRGVLGVETGTSIFDLDDSARERTEALLAGEPDLTFEEVERRVLHEYEGNVLYRTVGPRHFEAAAVRVCQILYEGHYSGILEADVHYLALKKDWSNFDDVMARFADPTVTERVTNRAYEDLIASGRWSYSHFIREIDEHLGTFELDGSMSLADRRALQRRLNRGGALRRLIAHPRWFIRNLPMPGRARATKRRIFLNALAGR